MRSVGASISGELKDTFTRTRLSLTVGRRCRTRPTSQPGDDGKVGADAASGGTVIGTFLRDTRAREAQADKYFQEIIEIADAATPETVNVARLRVDSRKFTVARLAPKKYGDHTQILISCSSAGEDEEFIEL